MIKKFNNNLSFKQYHFRFFEWIKLVSITGFAQVIVQGFGLLSGILIIRVLSIEQYALYTMANTILSTMIILADGGVGTGVMAQGGIVWDDKKKLGAVLATGLDLRKKFAVVSILIASPLLLLLLRQHNATWIMSFSILISLIPAFVITLSSNLLQIIPKLRQDLIPLQKNQVLTNVIRFSLLVPTLLAFPFAFVAVLISGLPLLIANRNLRKMCEKHVEPNQIPNSKIRKEILKIVSRLLPDSIYYCLSSQITIWIISIFGSTSTLAELGALGRLGMILGLISVLVTTLIAPRFARLPHKKTILLPRFFQIQAALFILSAIIIFVVWLFPMQILWILGEKYSSLENEIILVAISNCLGVISAACFSLCTFRGWVINPLIFIPLSILSIIIGVSLIDISSLRGIIVFNIFVSFIQVMQLMLFNIIKICKS